MSLSFIHSFILQFIHSPIHSAIHSFVKGRERERSGDAPQEEIKGWVRGGVVAAKDGGGKGSDGGMIVRAKKGGKFPQVRRKGVTPIGGGNKGHVRRGFCEFAGEGINHRLGKRIARKGLSHGGQETQSASSLGGMSGEFGGPLGKGTDSTLRHASHVDDHRLVALDRSTDDVIELDGKSFSVDPRDFGDGHPSAGTNAGVKDGGRRGVF